jgi:hypothetical protein
VVGVQASRKRCFVIMPFSRTSEIHTKEYWSYHFENRLKPLIESCSGLEAFRSEALRQDIVRQIVNDLVFTPVVVADLTDSNSNVYWELGVRQSFCHGTVTIAEENSRIPFDISTKGILFYRPKDFDRANDFAERFRGAILDCLSHPDRPDSVVLETITGRGSIYSVIRQKELVQRVEGLLSENEVNEIVLDQIYRLIFENKGKRFSFIRGKQVIATRLSSSAIDLLLAERYLEENTEFYVFMHSLLTMIYSINHQLSTWDYNSNKQTEKWFLEKEPWFRDFFQRNRQKLNIIRKKLAASP